MHSKTLVGTLIVLFTTVQATISPAETEDVRKQIENANAALSRAYRMGDAKKVAQMYTHNAQLFPPNHAIVNGQEDIQSFWETVMGSGVAELKLTTLEVDSLGNSVVETGTATLTDANGAIVDDAKYVVLWKRVDGTWKLHRDCWNSNRPAQ